MMPEATNIFDCATFKKKKAGGADINDPEVRIHDKFCHLDGAKAKLEVGFDSFNEVVAKVVSASTDLYAVTGAYKGFR